jgi:hypothetical protein
MGPDGRRLRPENRCPAEQAFATVAGMERSCLHCREPVSYDRAPAWARCGSCGLRQRVTAGGAFRWPAVGSAAQAWARSLGVDRPDV